jgi:hypothetical protein
MIKRIQYNFLLCCLFSFMGCASSTPARWFARAADDKASERAVEIRQLDLAVDAPSEVMPVTAGLHCLPAGTAESKSDDSEFEVWVKVRIADGFYLHAPDEQHPEMIPLKLSLQESDAVKVVSDFNYPTGSKDEHGFAIYQDEVLLGATIRLDGRKREKVVVKALLNYQVCTANSCRPPEEAVLAQEIVPQAYSDDLNNSSLADRE